MFKTLKIIFSDVVLLYKIFFSWLFLKTKVFLFSSIFAGIIVFPLGLLGFFYTWSNGMEAEKFTNWTFGNDNFLNFLMFFIYIIYFLVFSYCFIFLLKYYFEFLEKKQKIKFPIFKNFFDFKLFFRYLGLFSIIFLIFGGIIGLFAIFIFYYNYFYSFEIAEKNILDSVLSLPSILGFLVFIFCFYIFYKIIFSFAFLASENLKIIESIKKSFSHTKGYKKFIKIIFVTFVFLSFYFPFYSIKTSLETENKNILNYVNFIKSGQINKEDRNYFLSLRHKYQNLSTEDLQKKYQASAILTAYPNNYINFFSVLYFILFFGIVPFIYTSIFNNIIKK